MRQRLRQCVFVMAAGGAIDDARFLRLPFLFALTISARLPCLQHLNLLSGSSLAFSAEVLPGSSSSVIAKGFRSAGQSRAGTRGRAGWRHAVLLDRAVAGPRPDFRFRARHRRGGRRFADCARCDVGLAAGEIRNSTGSVSD